MRGAEKKTERWKKIAVAAAKQCGKTDLPEIRDICLYEEIAAELDGYDLVLFACLMNNTVSVKESLKYFKAGKILVFVGPEGDFTPEEAMLLANKSKCRFVSLGKRVLKSDTAGLFLLSILNYEFSL
ncbi:MAG: RsmE family RNA methyltransferase [Candidatus Omnitrophota bacterium]